MSKFLLEYLVRGPLAKVTLVFADLILGLPIKTPVQPEPPCQSASDGAGPVVI